MTQLSNREMQCFGAMCLRRFCRHFGIEHVAIDELTNHLISILVTTDISAWNVKGTGLVITGRGDAVPEFVTAAVPVTRLDAFQGLIEHVVEIGLVDLFGADTGRPHEFFASAQRVLSENGVSIPDQALVYLQDRPLPTPWGAPLSERRYDAFIDLLTSIDS